MTTAIPLLFEQLTGAEELDWAPLDLEQVPVEARAAIEAAEARIHAGTAQIVWEDDVAAMGSVE